MNKKEQRIFKLLKTLAMSGDFVGNASLAACVVYKNDIIAFGQNSSKSHPFQSKYAKNSEAVYLHAETCAIKNAMKMISTKELEDTTLFVLRVKKDGSIGTSKPCIGCARCISTFNMKKVKYTVDGYDKFFEQIQ